MDTVKVELRRKMQKFLLEMDAERRAEKSRRACDNLISTRQFQDASMVMIYLSLPHEVDTTEVILNAWRQSKTVAVPRISWEQRHMIAVELHSLESGFSTDANGYRNPLKGMPVPMAEIDIVVTPALAFDRQGNRLGRGGAYYDRFFSHNELKTCRCGLAFAEQVVESVPVSSLDKSMDLLVTDEEVLSFDKGD